MNWGTIGRGAVGSVVPELHTPEPTTTKAPKRKGQTHEVLFVFTETSSLPLNTRLTSNGINYHVSARNLTQEMKEGHNLPRGVAGEGQRQAREIENSGREAVNEPLCLVIKG